MSFLHDLERWEDEWRGSALWGDVLRTTVRLLAPIAPFLAEEMWAMVEGEGSVHHAGWPEARAGTAPLQPSVTVVVQVDGRIRDRLHVSPGTAGEDLIIQARTSPRVRAILRDRRVRDVIVVPDRVVNFVTASRT